MSDRTLFFGLPLRDDETPGVEGLGSYIKRLAFSHAFAPSALLACLRDDQPTAKLRASLPKEMGSTHGYSAASMMLVQCLQDATGVDLIRSTMGRFGSLLSSSHLVRAKQGRYCPECVVSSLDAEGLHGMLAWEIECLQCCPVHGVLLRMPTDCSKEGTRLQSYRRPQFPGVCASCGSVGYRCQQGPTTAASDSQIWIAESVGRLISLPQSEVETFTPVTLRAGLAALIDNRYQGSRKKAAADASLARSTLSVWLSGGSNPGLGPLMALCFKAHADIVALFSGRYQRIETPDGTCIEQKRTRSKLKNDWGAIARVLALAQTSENPAPLSNVAKELGANERTIRTRLPEQVAAYAAARRAALARIRRSKEQRLLETFTEIAEVLAGKGRKVARTNLCKLSGFVCLEPKSARGMAMDTVIARYANAREHLSSRTDSKKGEMGSQ